MRFGSPGRRESMQGGGLPAAEITEDGSTVIFVPLFELTEAGLSPYRRLHPGPELYEQEIEALAWDNLESFLGESFFPVARQARLPGGGIPDILALDEQGRVVVIEVKRDIDRGQLAQCLEYAGWARLTSLDEIAGLYNRSNGHRGVEAFFRDWQDFTESTTPRTIEPSPRLFLIARDFEKRTQSALDFLQENRLPVMVVPVSIYEDPSGRRIVDIEAEHEPAPLPGTPTRSSPRHFTVDGRRVTLQDLLDAGMVVANEPVEFVRPRIGDRYDATILGDGTFRLDDGSVHLSPSLAAMRAADLPAYDGWYAWRVPRLGGTKLHELREKFIADSEGGADTGGDAGLADGATSAAQSASGS